MNENKIVEFKTKKVTGLFVSVPSIYKTFKIGQYRNETSYLMEADTDPARWMMVIPTGKYEVIGLSNQLNYDQIKRLGLSYNAYLNLLTENDITVNYSDSSNFLAVLLRK